MKFNAILKSLPLALAISTLLGSSAFAGTTFTYGISGGFKTSTGPGKPYSGSNGKFDGSMTWYTDANGGQGGWTQWDIKVRDNTTTAPTLFTFSSLNSGQYVNNPSAQTYSNLDPSKGATAGCFVSPVNDGNKADSTSPVDFYGNNVKYNTSSPGGSICRGGVVTSGVQTNPPGPDLFSIYQIVNTMTSEPYKWDSGPTGGGYYNYFRVDVQPDSNFNTPGNSGYGKLYLVTGNQGAQYWGWSSLLRDPANGTATPVNCAGNNDATVAGTCPYGGSNTQTRSNFDASTASLVLTLQTVTPDSPPVPTTPSGVPAPVAGLGLASGFMFTRKLRRRVLQAG